MKVYLYNISGTTPVYSCSMGFISGIADDLLANDELIDVAGRHFKVTNIGTFVSHYLRESVELTDIDGHGRSPTLGGCPLWTPTAKGKLSQAQFTDIPLSILHLIRNRDALSVLDEPVGEIQEVIDETGEPPKPLTFFHFTLDATDISNKYHDTGVPPTNLNKVILLVGGAPNQSLGMAYIVDNTGRLIWDGYELDGVLATGDRITLAYYE